VSVDTAVEWLRSWSPEGPWHVLEIDPEAEVKHPEAHAFFEEEHLRRYLTERDGKTNLYFLPNPTRLGIKSTPHKTDILSLTSLYVDLDLPKAGPYSAPTPENFERLLRRLRALNPAPTLLVFSGGGYQAFWLFPEPIDVVALERVEAASKAIARTLESDAVQNVNRLMRIPGTMNLPDAKKRARGRVPTRSEVVEAQWGRRWSFETDPIPRFPDDYAAYADDGQDPPVTASRKVVADIPPRYQKLIKSGDASDYGGDRSRMVIGVVFALVRRGWADEDIQALLLDPSNGLSAHVLEQGNPTAYARRQVQRARDEVSSDWDRLSTGGLDAGSPRNVSRALDELGVRLSHDIFKDRTYVNGIGPLRELDDPTVSELRILTHQKFGFVPMKDILNDVLSTTARASTFHPVWDYLDGLAWDGVPRIDDWLITYCRCEVTDDLKRDYLQAVGRLMLLAAVRRIRRPGTKFDQMLVLISPTQGTNKSTAIAALCPQPEWFSDSVPLKITDQKAIEQLQGRWIIECSELQGMNQADVETLKSFLSKTEDRARLAYGHYPVAYARRCVFFATTNSTAFLRDTENRRYWPVFVGKVDVEALERDRDQLWAEASRREALGESIVLPESLWPVAATYQQEVRVGDAWTEYLQPHFNGIHAGKISVNDVWELLGKPGHQRGGSEGARLTEVMRELGWTRNLQRIDGTVMRCFTIGAGDRATYYTQYDPVANTRTLVAAPAAGTFEPATLESDLPF
jgi:hypothetical protein